MTDADGWPIIASETEYETGWYHGGYDLVEQPDGSEKRYYWADLPPAVVIVAQVDGQVLFVEQYRPVIRETHLELPAGIVEERDVPAERRTEEVRRTGERSDLACEAAYTRAAARELEEETGFRPTSATLLQEYAVATGVLRHDRGVVYAEGLEPGQRVLDSNEFLEVRTVPVAEALDRAREPPVNDSTLSALLLADDEGLL